MALRHEEARGKKGEATERDEIEEKRSSARADVIPANKWRRRLLLSLQLDRSWN